MHARSYSHAGAAHPTAGAELKRQLRLDLEQSCSSRLGRVRRVNEQRLGSMTERHEIERVRCQSHSSTLADWSEQEHVARDVGALTQRSHVPMSMRSRDLIKVHCT